VDKKISKTQKTTLIECNNNKMKYADSGNIIEK